MPTRARFAGVEESTIEAAFLVGLSARRQEWSGLGAFRVQTSGSPVIIAAQPQHWITVQVGPSPTQTELRFDRTVMNSCHLPGNINLIPAGTDTRWQFSVPTDDIVLDLSPALLARVASESGGHFAPVELVLSSGTADTIIERMSYLLHGELENGGASGRLFGEGLATALAAHLLTHHAARPVPFREYVRGLGKADLSRILDFIQDQLADDLSLSDLASSVCLSPYHFCRLFKQSTGQSPHQYVITQRVERAKSLLRRGGLTVGEVAQAVGFSDHSKLHHHFKKKTGLTPGQYSKR